MNKLEKGKKVFLIIENYNFSKSNIEKAEVQKIKKPFSDNLYPKKNLRQSNINESNMMNSNTNFIENNQMQYMPNQANYNRFQDPKYF